MTWNEYGSVAPAEGVAVAARTAAADRAFWAEPLAAGPSEHDGLARASASVEAHRAVDERTIRWAEPAARTREAILVR